MKTRSASFRGITIGTLGRGEGYHFLQMGAFIERADWSIRLLDMIGNDAELPESGEARDATLAMPRLILPSVQVNIRAGHMPEPEANGVRYLKLPIDLL